MIHLLTLRKVLTKWANDSTDTSCKLPKENVYSDKHSISHEASTPELFVQFQTATE